MNHKKKGAIYLLIFLSLSLVIFGTLFNFYRENNKIVKAGSGKLLSTDNNISTEEKSDIVSNKILTGEFTKIDDLFRKGKNAEVKSMLDLLVKENEGNESLSKYLKESEAGKSYSAGTLGVDFLKEEFGSIHKLYIDGKYDEVKKELDELVKTKGDSEGVKDFIKNTDIGKAYTSGTLGTDFLKTEFGSIHKLYEAGKYDEVKKELDELVKTKGETEGVKDFIKNTDIGKAYKSGTLGTDFLKTEFGSIHKLYEEGKYDELKLVLDDLLKNRGNSEGVKDFFKNTDIGRLYMKGTLGEDYLQNEFAIIHELYEAEKYDEVKKKLDYLVKTRGNKDGLKDFLLTTDIGTAYTNGTLGQDYIQNELSLIDKLYSEGKYDEVKKRLDNLIKTRGEKDGIKAFLEDNPIGRAYKSGKL